MAGIVIAIIDDSRLQTKKSQLQTNIEQAKLQLVQIKAQIHTFNSQITAETAKVNRIITATKAALSDRHRQYQEKKITTVTPPTNSTNGSLPYANTTPKAAVSGTFYHVTIEPESLFLGKGKNLCPIQLGMEGRVDIISREETVLQFFLRKARLIADV